jgi:hypothetical protein
MTTHNILTTYMDFTHALDSVKTDQDLKDRDGGSVKKICTARFTRIPFTNPKITTGE